MKGNCLLQQSSLHNCTLCCTVAIETYFTVAVIVNQLIASSLHSLDESKSDF